MKSYLILFVALIVTGCASKATVSENQCRAGDWQTIGYRDGASGVTNTRLLSHQDACGAFGIVPDRDSYLAGWQAGLESYCTADSGFNLGLRGASLNSACRNELREPFASAHADGRSLYVARRDVRRLSQQLASMEQRLGQIKQEMVGATTAQLTPNLSVEERLSLLAKLESLADERGNIKSRLPEVERSLAQAEDQLARVDQSLASR
jgi:hypothetical protein